MSRNPLQDQPHEGDRLAAAMDRFRSEAASVDRTDRILRGIGAGALLLSVPLFLILWWQFQRDTQAQGTQASLSKPLVPLEARVAEESVEGQEAAAAPAPMPEDTQTARADAPDIAVLQAPPEPVMKLHSVKRPRALHNSLPSAQRSGMKSARAPRSVARVEWSAAPKPSTARSEESARVPSPAPQAVVNPRASEEGLRDEPARPSTQEPAGLAYQGERRISARDARRENSRARRSDLANDPYNLRKHDRRHPDWGWD